MAVPLTNLLVPGGYALLQKNVAALAMSVQDPDWTPLGNSDPPRDPFAMFHDLKDRLPEGVRWYPEAERDSRVDTRMTAKLFMVQTGTETAALSVAMTRARLALAIWCLLDPPDATTLWPAIGQWLPRPHIEAGIDYKLYEPGKFTGSARARGRWTHHYREYTVTADPVKLAAPFEMMRLAQTMIGPRAIVSAAWALHLAERQPSDLERTDVLVHLRAAIESLLRSSKGSQRHQRREALGLHHGAVRHLGSIEKRLWPGRTRGCSATSA